MTRRPDGFTLIELMIVVTIVGILAAIALPNYASMSENARKSAVKSNMHTVQLATEDFAVQNQGIYPVAGDQAALLAMMPMGQYPMNPFTKNRDAWVYAAPAAPGIVGFTTATVTNYVLEGYGRDALLPLQLHN